MNKFFATEPCVIRAKCKELEKNDTIFTRSNAKVIKTYIFDNKLISGTTDCEFLFFDLLTNSLYAKYNIKIPQFLTFCLTLNPEPGLISCNSSTLFSLNLSKQAIELSIETQENSITCLESIPNQQILLCLSEKSLIFFDYPSFVSLKKIQLQSFISQTLILIEKDLLSAKLSKLKDTIHKFLMIYWTRSISKVKFTKDLSVFTILDCNRKVDVYIFENLDCFLSLSVDKVKASAFCLAERGKKYLLVSDMNKKIFKINPNKLKKQILGELPNDIQDINLNETENLLAIWFSDSSIALFDPKTLEKFYQLPGITLPLLFLAYIPEDFKIICQNSNSLYLINARTEQYTEFLKGDNHSCCLTSNFEQLIVGNSSLSIFDTNSLNLCRTIKTGVMTLLRLEPHSQLFIFIDSANDIVFWQYDKAHERQKISFKCSKYVSITMFAKSKYLLTVQETGTCNIWRLKNIINELPFEFHSSSITCAQFSENEDFLLTASSDSNVVQWNLNTRKVLQVFETDSGITSLALHPNNDFFVAGHSSGLISTWSISKSQKLSETFFHTSEVSGLKYMNPSYLISASKDNSIKILDLKDFSIKHSIQLPSPAFSLDLSANQKYLTVCAGNTVRVYLTSKPEKFLNFGGHKKIVYCVCIFNRTQEVLSGSFDNTIKVWSVSKKKCERSLSGHTACVWSLKIMDNELMFISCSWDNQAIVWDACSYQPLHTLQFAKSALWGVELANKSFQALFFLDHNVELRDLLTILKNKQPEFFKNNISPYLNTIKLIDP